MNLFNKEFKVFSCFSSTHRDCEMMTCLDFAGGFVKAGDPDPIEIEMEKFLREPVEFEMP